HTRCYRDWSSDVCSSDLCMLKTFSDQFVTCIGRVEAAGLIRRLSFGNLVLLQPEILDTYASALVNVVRDEPDGLGSILEEKVREIGRASCRRRGGVWRGR